MNLALQEANRKKTIVKLIVIFLAVMLGLTFFSKTINNLSLPRVKTEEPGNGALLKEVSGEGIVEARESFVVYPALNRQVEEIRVQPGDPVRKGQLLALLDAGVFSESLHRALTTAVKNSANIERILETLAARAVPGGNLEGLDKELALAGELVRKNEENLAAAQQLFAIEAESAEGVKRARQTLADAKLALELKEYERTRRIRENLLFLKSVVLIAPGPGIVTAVNLNEGTLTDSRSIVTIANPASGFEFIVTVLITKAKYLALGDPVDVSFEALNGKTIEGTLQQMRDNIDEKGVKKDLIITLPTDEEINGGERGEIYIAKKTKFFNILVSNSAVGEDDKGKYVWILKNKKGPLGDEFYVKRAGVMVADQDDFNTGLLSGIEASDRVIIKFTKPLTDGCQVIPE